MLRPLGILVGLVVFGVILVACGDDATPTPAATSTPPPATATPEPSATPVATSTPQPTPTVTPLPTPTPDVIVRPGKRGGSPNASTTATVSHFGIHECAGSDNSCAAHPAPNYNGLMEYNPETDDTADLRCDLCTDWELADDGVTYTFFLDPDAVWNDGRPVTAVDVAFSFDRMKDPENTIPSAKVHVIRPFYESARAIDANTVEIVTKFPAPMFLPFISSEYFKMLPKYHVEAIPDGDMKPFENRNGSGPYRMTEFEGDVKIEYVRNENYFKDGLPYFDAMTYFIITEASATQAAFETEQILFHTHANNGIATRALTELQKGALKGIGRIVWMGPIAPLWVQINHLREPFDDVRVRHALSLAIHRPAFTEILSEGIDEIGGPFPPSSWYGYTEEELEQKPGYRVTADGEKHPDDLAEAKRLLAEAGVPENFKVELLMITFSVFGIYSPVFVDQLRTNLGWDATARIEELQSFVARRAEGQYVLGVGGYGITTNDPHDIIGGVYHVNGQANTQKWEHPRIEELYLLQARELDRVKRKALVDEVADILIEEDSVFINIFHTILGHYANNKIHNLHPTGSLTDALKAEHFWCDPSC